MGCPEGSGLGTFRITLVRPLHFYSVPKYGPSTLRWFNDRSHAGMHIGTNLQRRSDSMLRRPFDRRNTLAACVPSRARSFGFIVTPILREAPTLHRCISETISTETRKLLVALGYQPRTIPASLHHTA